jgi:hypothetical protein
MAQQIEYSERHLERAVQHVSAHWFPINPEALLSVRNGLETGAYDLDITFLINELKIDFALFTFCVKELIGIAAREHVPFTISSDPVKLLRWGGAARLRTILGSKRQPPNSHTLKDCEPFMQDRLKETGIAASTAEVLAQNQKLDPEAYFCHGVVRQIGLNLIAWNYPSLYARAIRSLDAHSNIDEELSNELGFSPSLLALRLLRPELPGNNPQVKQIEQGWASLDQLCEVGEALARASNPATYPTAEKDWATAHSFILQTIGTEGLDLVRRRAVDNTLSYRKVLPGTFAALSSLDPEVAIKDFRVGLRAKENTYVKLCTPAVQAALTALYAEMPRTSVNKLALEKLVKQIIPQAGFTGGCVFVVDPTAMSLIPRTGIGKVQLRRLVTVPLKSAPGAAMAPLISEVISTGARPPTDLASAAFACDQPLIERSDVEGNDVVAGIYCSLGKKRRIGVLYLELPERELNSTDPQALKTFKALRQSLCDALLVE